MLLDTPGGIKIQTIHSFCQEILKRFPLEAGVSPYFEIMDDRAAAEAAEEIKNRLIAEIRGNPGSPAAEAMAFLTENVSELKFPEIIGTIINERGKISRLFKRWSSAGELLAAQAARLGVAPDADERELNRLFFDALPREELKTLLAAWLKSGVRFARRAEKLAAALQNSAPEDFTDYTGAFLGSDGEAYKTVAAKAVLENNPRLAEIFAEEAARVREQTEKQKALRVFLATKAVVVLAGELTKGYENYKQAHALMDYNDMILLTRRLLDDREAARWVLFKLDGGIDDILIDEAQDTSPDQWAIIRAVSEEFFCLRRRPAPHRFLPSATANSRFTVFRGRIPTSSTRCAAISHKKPTGLNRLTYRFPSVRPRRCWTPSTVCFPIRKFPPASLPRTKNRFTFLSAGEKAAKSNCGNWSNRKKAKTPTNGSPRSNTKALPPPAPGWRG